MSHTVTMKVELQNRDLLKQACAEMNIKFREGAHQVTLYQGKVSCDFSFQLPNWNYPIALQGDQVKYDNYEGKWGRMEEFEKLQNKYCELVVRDQMDGTSFSLSDYEDEGDEIVMEYTDYS